MITGATDGIGRQTALVLARQGCRLVLHGRDASKGEQILRESGEAGSPDCVFYTADLASLRATAELAVRVREDRPDINVLINNAGVYCPERKLSTDGFEMSFAVNYLAPFLLTTELLDVLQKNSPSRIVNVTSIAYRNAVIPYDDLNWEKSYNGWKAYKASKLALVLFTFMLARRLEGSYVTANCLHPGAVDTKMLRSVSPDTRGVSIQEGAVNSIMLATSLNVQGASGLYFENQSAVEASPAARDLVEQEKLWRLSEKLVAPYRLQQKKPA